MKIQILSNNETIIYAAEEFKKYLQMMDDSLSCEIVTDNGDIKLGILSQLSLYDGDVCDTMTDDVIDIDISSMKGYIAGSNGRSVLMGVYNFLKSAGCMWVRPGCDGEYIPKKDMKSHSFCYRKKADITFRGECIEGAVSYENLRDHILWLPKVNMNLFMMEQIVPYNYISRWYKHSVSTVKKDENVSFEKIAEYTISLEKLIKKCGLQLHSLGHGYLLEPYGIHYKTGQDKYELNDKARQDVALVNGVRSLYRGSPNFTQLCFSKDSARKGLVDFLVDYLNKKPYIDFLHVWLSDSANNQCECENCRKMIPTDFYVQILNELDSELTKRHINTKIVFIMYIDTFWAPEKTKLNNPERFIMTTASVRSYSETYSPKRLEGELPPYKRNEYYIKPDFSHTLSFMDEWKKVFDGKRFLFEYNLYTDHYFDPGYMSIAKTIMTDIQNLEKIEFDGIMCDQTQRSFFPTGLPNAVMGEGMFEKDMDFDAYTDAYFEAAFGADGNLARIYLQKITDTFNPDEIRSNDSVVNQDTGTGEDEQYKGIKNNKASAERIAKVADLVNKFLPVIEKNISLLDPCHRKSWEILSYHAVYCKKLSEILVCYANGNTDNALELFDSMIDYLSHIEDEIQPYFDLVLFNQRIKKLLNS